MQHCSDEALISYLDGELDAGEQAGVHQHLNQCWACRNRLSQFERQVLRLAGAAETGLFPEPSWKREVRRRLEIRMRESRSVLESQSMPPANVPAPQPSLAQTRRVPFSLPAPAAWGASVALAMVTGAAFLLMPARIEAKAVLQQSLKAERAALRNVRAQRKTWTLEQYQAGHFVGRRKVEQWQGPDARPAALRVFDDDQRLVDGEWVSSTGSAVRFGQRAATPSSPAGVPADLDDAGLLPLSTQSFVGLMGEEPKTSIRHEANSLALDLASRKATPNTGPATSSNTDAEARPRVVRASLVLDEASLRPTKGVLVVRSSRSGEVEFRLEETAFERYVDTTPPASVFLPDEKQAMPAVSRRGTAESVLTAEGETPEPVLLPSADPSLEVRLIQKLSMENVTLGDEIRLERLPGGTLALTGRMGSAEKLEKIRGAVQDEVDRGVLRINVTLGSSASNALVTERFIEWTIERMQSAGTLPPGCSSSRGGTCDAARQAALDRARLLRTTVARVVSHSVAVREVGGRFQPEEVARMSEDERAAWQLVTAQHAQALRSELTALERTLRELSGDAEGSLEVPPVRGRISGHLLVQDAMRVERATAGLLCARSGKGEIQASAREVFRSIAALRARLDLLVP